MRELTIQVTKTPKGLDLEPEMPSPLKMNQMRPSCYHY